MAGILCSVACAIHCMLIPVITLLSPTLTSYFENEWIHIGLLFIVVPIALTSFYQQKRIHEKIKPMILGSIGIFFLISAIVSEQLFNIEIEKLEFVLTMIGSTFLIVGHLYNIRYLNTCIRKRQNP